MLPCVVAPICQRYVGALWVRGEVFGRTKNRGGHSGPNLEGLRGDCKGAKMRKQIGRWSVGRVHAVCSS